ILFGLVLEYENLRLLSDQGHPSGHPGALDEGFAHLDAVVARHEAHPVELHDIALGGAQTLDVDHVPRGDAVLLATGLNDCVHDFHLDAALGSPAGGSRLIGRDFYWPRPSGKSPRSIDASRCVPI